jgi:hypothetical protein
LGVCLFMTGETMAVLFSDIDSTSIQTVDYDTVNQELTINFHEGSVAVHHNVPLRAYIELLDAESTGRFYNEFIKGKFPNQQQFAVGDNVQVNYGQDVFYGTVAEKNGDANSMVSIVFGNTYITKV